jgi:hypothetical protein
MPVNISGVQGTLKAMREFDNDLYKGMNKQIKAAMLPIRDKARGFAPANSSMLSGWTKAASSTETINYRAFPKYDQAETQKGITYNQGANKRNAAGFSMTHYVANRSAGGAIYETAGRKSGPDGQPAGGRTLGYAGKRFGAGPIIPVWASGKDINTSLNPEAGRQFIARANANGELVNARPRQQGQRGRVSRMSTGRLIYRAFAEDQGRATRAINLAIENAVKTFNTTNTQAKYALGA